MKRKEKMYFYNPNNKSMGELACWCWHKEDPRPDRTMTLHYFMENGEIVCFASFGYWSWTNGIEPTEVSYNDFCENVKRLLPNANIDRAV